jgi:hypothetical protein
VEQVVGVVADRLHRHRQQDLEYGVGGTAGATGMASMTNDRGSPDNVLGLLLRIGPWLLIVPVLLVVAAFSLGRHRAAAVGALLAGAVGYVGRYAQPDATAMYAVIASGYATWAASTSGCDAKPPLPGPRPDGDSQPGTCARLQQCGVLGEMLAT